MGVFCVDRERKVWCAKPWSVRALRSFFLTLTCRDAKETPRDPCAGKYSMIKARKSYKIYFRDQEASFIVAS